MAKLISVVKKVAGFSRRIFLRSSFGVRVYQKLGLSPVLIHHHHRIICLTSYLVHSRSVAPYSHFSRWRSHLSISCPTSSSRRYSRLVTISAWMATRVRGCSSCPTRHSQRCGCAISQHQSRSQRYRSLCVEDGMRLFAHEAIGTCG
jgi:hypothetical protein